MPDPADPHTLADLQRDARSLIDGINRSHEPIPITVDGRVRAILVDPVSYERMEKGLERERFLAALEEGLEDVDAGRTRPLEEAYRETKAQICL